ncbi:MAG: hypothetical protein CVV27_08395 [Candidatus Melainabacteria bacterium HGW-Melainabacteria-1]|nr:MAG: hypothetical protein CVV27_08395 [Candidatus Melainabacteria bacterium HGW-Melainabacteria-1]
MRKSNWLILLTFGCSGVTLAAGLAVWLNFQTRSQAPVQLPAQGDDRTYAELALSLAARERYEDALAANARALSYNPANAALLYNQGWLESRLGRWQQALEFLARAQAQAPDDPEVRYTRVWVLQQLGRRKQWQNELKQAQRIKWQPTSAYARARLHQLAGEHPQAVKAFGQALSEQPKQGAGFYYARSQSLRILKQDTQALADLDRVIQWHPTAELYRERAAVHERLDQLEPALADLAHSQALDPRRETRLARARINPASKSSKLCSKRIPTGCQLCCCKSGPSSTPASSNRLRKASVACSPAIPTAAKAGGCKGWCTGYGANTPKP